MDITDISISITINNARDVDKVTEILKKQEINKPVYLITCADVSTYSFSSDYGYFEIEDEIMNVFSDHEFISEVGHGRKEIKMSILRSSYGEDFSAGPIEKALYLVRKGQSEKVKPEPNPSFKVLFGEVEKEYTVHIVEGKNNSTGEKGFVVVKSLNKSEESDLLIDRLFRDRTEAFYRGFNFLSNQIEADFEEHTKNSKRKRKK